MSSEIELDDLSSPPKQEDESLSGGVTPPKDDQVVTVWAWVSSILLLLVAVPLVLFPRFLLFASEDTGVDRRAILTPLEAFLALHTGILLVAIALAIIFNVPSAPVTTPSTDQVVQGHPLLAPLSGACILIAFLSYNTTSVGSLAFLLFLGSATVGLWGLWAIMFAGSSYISKKTGADKRTSRFIFGNKAAASVRKKQWKKEHGTKS